MVNTNKKGYSTLEVAQILGCHPHTILHRIDDGSLKAEIQEPLTPGGRRRIRISREAITDYLRNNSESYNEATLKAWGADKKPTKADYETNDMSKFGVTSLDMLSGAWADLAKEATETLNKPSIADESKSDTETEKTYYIFVDGRLCLGNMSSETARTIINALMTDKNFGYHQVTVKRM